MTTTDQTRPDYEAIADELGITADLMNRLAYQWRPHQESLDLFEQWYDAVIKPIELPAEPAWKMFIGKTSIEDYVLGMTDDQSERFVSMFPSLQADHQARIDSGEVF
jgi:hypothetical protein